MLKSPVLAPAMSRVIPTPMVSENGLTAGVSVAFAVPETMLEPPPPVDTLIRYTYDDEEQSDPPATLATT